MATVEAINQSTEQNKFLRSENIRKVGSPIFDHTNGAATGHATRLNGTANERYGLAKSLSVMPGDVIKMEVFAKYLDGNTANWTAALTNLISQIAAGTAPAGTVIDGGGYAVSTATFPFPDMLGKAVEAGPKAYLNWLVFDRHYKLTASKSGYKPMTTLAAESGQDVAHEKLDAEIVIAEAGYVYIYLSNEEATPVEVFFDDFKVQHTQSPVVQSDEYYPFGLAFKSYNRENSAPQDYKYNGKEEQTELGLGWLDYGARMYQPELGRFFTQDRFAEKYAPLTPYQYAALNPVKYIDVNGDSVWVTSTSSVEDFGNGTSRTTVHHTIHVTGKVLDASDSYVDVNEVAAGIQKGLNALSSSDSHREGDNTFVTKISVDAKIEVAQSMDDVASSDHLITIVDNLLGNADRDGGGGNASGLGAMFGKISYIEGSSFGSAGMISGGIHELGHNMGLGHNFADPSNYMSYSSERSRLNYSQMESIVNGFYDGKQNQGTNYSISGSSSRNTLWPTQRM